VAVLYFLVTGTAAHFTEAVDPHGFIVSLAGYCVIGGVLLAAVAWVVSRAVREPVDQA